MSAKKEVSIESHNAKEEVAELLTDNIHSGMSKSLDPVYRVIKEETVSPRGQLLNLERGIYDQILYKSTLCMAAEQKSLSNISFSRIIRKARKVLTEQGLEPQSVKEVLKQIKVLIDE